MALESRWADEVNQLIADEGHLKAKLKIKEVFAVKAKAFFERELMQNSVELLKTLENLEPDTIPF